MRLLFTKFLEVNLASDAEAYRKGEKSGWIATTWDGIQNSIELPSEKRIKLISNGGCLNPRVLVVEVYELVI